MQNALNGKIYIARTGQDHGDSLSIINSPNNISASCNFIYNGLSLNPSYGALGLANIIESYFSDISDFPCISNKIDNPQLPESIKVFPNPFEHSLSLSIESNDLVMYSIKMIDVLGRQQRLNINYLNNDKLIHIETDDPAEGVYFLLIEGSINKKFFNKSIIVYSKNSKS